MPANTAFQLIASREIVVFLKVSIGARSQQLNARPLVITTSELKLY